MSVGTCVKVTIIELKNLSVDLGEDKSLLKLELADLQQIGLYFFQCFQFFPRMNE